MRRIEIGGIPIGRDVPVAVVAEMSGNHNGSLDRALAIVRSAAASGASMLKLQTYTPDSMTLNLRSPEFFISEEDSLWKKGSLYDLYKSAHTPREWHKPIYELARDLGMVCFSTPFDEDSVDFLEQLGTPCYKIASSENVDIPLIKKVSKTGMPVIISTGMATESEINEAVTTARESGCDNLILLKCTSAYPAEAKDANLATITNLREQFNCDIGLSDHTEGIGVSLAGITYGAVMIERHFTMDRNDGGVDSLFSLEPNELKQLVIEAEKVRASEGRVFYGPTPSEMTSLKYRRSLYICEDLKSGDVLTRQSLRSIRPGHGLSPKYYDELLGKTVNRDVEIGTPVTWDILD